jgi:hypothetical protein
VRQIELSQLTLFSVLIVVLTMVGLAVLVTQLSRESSTGKADARLAASMDSALSVYDGELEESRRAAHEAARTPCGDPRGGRARGRRAGPAAGRASARSPHRRVEGAAGDGERGRGDDAEAARDVRSLIAVADEAIYRAKRGGKNRSEQAEPAHEPAWSAVAQGQASERRT